ncbi:hypothetical protein D9758_006917 [Tetrapyrgos nigripes]|uniref:DUF6699 domain-containing protein n=1 Tax=Tetrapyrgos nigripes TaxID=182062 RepID=A0A8H5LUU9_9AGAR|nr:hypothetical protein D9758_006917 [Tetrapyrgos nigripes]
MTKQVRFAPENRLYSPKPFEKPLLVVGMAASQQSSTSSSSSATSQSSDKLKARSRAGSIPSPLIIPETPTRLHYLLAYLPFQHPAVFYDLSLHPSILERLHPATTLSESATDPPMASMIVTCPHLNWELHIAPSTGSMRPYISVADVFRALYSGLRKAVHPMEYEALPSYHALHVNQAYFTRCGFILDDYVRMEEQKKGVKRVDFLLGRNRFLGLSSRKGDSRVWELNVS